MLKLLITGAMDSRLRGNDMQRALNPYYLLTASLAATPHIYLLLLSIYYPTMRHRWGLYPAYDYIKTL
jgi:hypothetical protein